MFSRQFLIRFSVLWVLMIIVGSFLPSRSKIALGIDTGSWQPAIRRNVQIKHGVAHFSAFGIAALALAVLAENLIQRSGAVVGILTLGLLIELLQKVIDGGRFEYWDLRDDTYGVVAGSALGAWHTVRACLLRPAAKSNSASGW